MNNFSNPQLKECQPLKINLPWGGKINVEKMINEVKVNLKNELKAGDILNKIVCAEKIRNKFSRI